MASITAEAFIQKLKDEKRVFPSETLVVQGTVKIIDLSNDDYSIRNCDLTSVIFEGVEVNKVEFVYSKIESISFIDSDINFVGVSGITQLKRFSTDNGTRFKSLRISIQGSLESLQIDKSSIKEFYTEETSFGNVDIDIIDHDCSFTVVSNVNFSSLKISGAYSTMIFRSGGSSKINFENIKCGSVELSQFGTEELNFVNLDADSLVVTNSNSIKILFQDVDIGRVRIIERLLGEILLKGFFKGYFGVEPQGETLSCNLSLNELSILTGSIVNIKNVNLSTFLFDFVENQGIINIQDCTIERLTISDSNCGYFNLKSVKSNDFLSVIRSNFSKTNLEDNRWEEVLVDDFDPNLFRNELEFNENLRSTFNQLKDGALKRNDKFGSLYFKRKEAEVLFKILNSEKFSSSGDGLLVNLTNYFSHFIHRYSSNYSQNIWRPFILFFIVHWFLLLMLFLLNPEMGIGIGWPIDNASTCKAIDIYFQTILPTHSADILKGNSFFDFLIRITSGYFIFYFITATRKYHM